MLSPEPLNMYYTVFQWYKVRSVFILKCIIGFQSQSIDFKNEFAQADIPSVDPVFIELPSDFKSDGEQCDFFLSLNKSLYGQDEVTCLNYEIL